MSGITLKVYQADGIYRCRVDTLDDCLAKHTDRLTAISDALSLYDTRQERRKDFNIQVSLTGSVNPNFNSGKQLIKYIENRLNPCACGGEAFSFDIGEKSTLTCDKCSRSLHTMQLTNIRKYAVNYIIDTFNNREDLT